MGGESQPKKYGQLWNREELILAFDLYCRIPFKKTKANNPEVIRLAKSLNRSAASVARKLGNFGSFDPELKKQQVTGLAHASMSSILIGIDLSWKRNDCGQSLGLLQSLQSTPRLISPFRREHPSERQYIRPVFIRPSSAKRF